MSAVLAEADSHGAWLEPMFDVAFDAPGGIVRLRQLILSLAMQGKLVPQLATEAPASDLVKRIAAEKAALVKTGELRAPKLLEPIADSNKPHAIPASWEWVRLGDIGEIFNGNSINASEKALKYVGKKGLPYIATKDVGYGLDALDYENGVSIPESESQFKVAHKGAVLICAEGGSAGKKCGVTDRDVCFGNKLFANEIYGGIPSLYILYAYLSPFFAVEFSKEMTGIIGGVSIAKFIEIPIPLPPLEEQRRIVARIGELMSRCDEFERLRQKQREKRAAARAAIMRQWLAGDDAASKFFGAHFATLASTHEDVAELRKAILQLAISGRLTQSNDVRLDSKCGSTSSDGPFAIPPNWRWVPLKEVSGQRGITYGIVKMEKEPISGGVFALRCSDVKYRKLDLSSVRKVTHEISEQYSRTILRGGELLLNIRGTLGGCAVVPESVAGYNIAREVAMIPLNDQAIPEYVLNVLSSPYFTEETNGNLRGIAYKGLNLGTLSGFMVPLPPIEEQKRIIARVDALMRLCDMLEQSIDTAQAKQAELLGAVMARV